MPAPPRIAPPEWALARRRTPFTVQAPRAIEMDVLLLLDIAAGRIAGVNAIAADASQTEAAEWVAATLARPLRGHARPRNLRVEGAGLAAAVRAKVGPRVAVRVASVPEADEAMASLIDRPSGGSTPSAARCSTRSIRTP